MVYIIINTLKITKIKEDVFYILEGMAIMQKDFVWEGTYGKRSQLKKILKALLRDQDASSLSMLAIFVNNNPYNLELYVVVSYSIPKKNHIETMINLFENIGLFQRKDLTFNQVFCELGNRRFNSSILNDENSVELMFDKLFFLPEIRELEEIGYHMRPFGKDEQVFISHSSKDKDELEKIIPYLNGQNLPVWFDKYSISAGMSITNSVQEGIEKSSIVILWVTENFLNSNWCKYEMNAFIKKLVEENCLLLTVLDDEINESRLPLFLRDIKYIKRNYKSVYEIAEELVKVIKKVKKLP